jgi:hypothetical protein
MQKHIERQGSTSVPYTHHYPQVRGGICEYCGVLDPNVPSQEQYKLCPHFRGIGQLACTYCPDHKDPVEVTRSTTLNIHQHPTDPHSLVVVCGSFECSQAHINRFKLNK